MKNFTYLRPESAEQAVGLLDSKWGKVELMAGGTDLIDLQKEYIAQPDKVVSLSGLKEFDKINILQREPPILSLGAGVKIADIVNNAAVKEHCPVLAAAARNVGTPQIRNMARWAATCASATAA